MLLRDLVHRDSLLGHLYRREKEYLARCTREVQQRCTHVRLILRLADALNYLQVQIASDLDWNRAISSASVQQDVDFHPQTAGLPRTTQEHRLESESH